MLNKEIAYNRFKSIFIAVITNLLLIYQLLSIRLQYECFNNILFFYLFKEIV